MRPARPGAVRVKNLRLIRIAVAIATFIVSLIVYVKTLSPTVGLVDSGELTAAAALVGNARWFRIGVEGYTGTGRIGAPGARR